jgi:hypothetical protein
MTLDFFANIRNQGAKVLHLSPYMFDQSQNGMYLIIEDENANRVQVTPDQLRDILNPDEGKIDIYLVIIELVNCEEFCEVFREFSIPHVISFSLKGAYEPRTLLDEESLTY